jgi:hypothetical protein
MWSSAPNVGIMKMRSFKKLMKSKFLVMFWAFFLLLGGMSFYLPRYPILLIPFILLCFAAPLSIIMMAKSGNNAEKLLKNGGVKTTARIVNVQDTGMTMNRHKYWYSVNLRSGISHR